MWQIKDTVGSNFSSEITNLQYHSLVRFARRHGATDAEDIVQEAFLILTKNRCSGKIIENENAWLYGIVKQLVFTRARSNSRRMKRLTCYKHTVERSRCRFSLESKAIAMAVRGVFSNLSVEDQRLLRLSLVMGYTLKEMANITDLSLHQVKFRLSKARRNLRTLLACLTEAKSSNQAFDAKKPECPSKSDFVKGTAAKASSED